MLALTRALRIGAGGVRPGWAESPILPRPLRKPARHLGRWFSGNVDPPRHATAIANAGLIAASLIYGAFAGGHAPTVVQASASAIGFSIRDLSLSGQVQTTEADIAAALGLTEWTSLVGFDVEAARVQLEKLPWVKAATVRKAYPSALAIALTERRAVAIWQHGDDLSLIDDHGETIAEFSDPRFAGLPLVTGAGAAAAVNALLPALAGNESIARRVIAHIRVGERRWDLRLDNGVTIRLPENGVEEALATLDGLAAEGDVFNRDVAAIDLRLKDRVAIELTKAGATARAEAVKAAIAAEKKARRT